MDPTSGSENVSPTTTQSLSKTASETPLHQPIKNSLDLDDLQNEIALSPQSPPCYTALEPSEKSTTSFRSLLARKRTLEASEMKPHREEFVRAVEKPTKWHRMCKFLARVWSFVRFGGRICHMLCPPSPHCIIRKALYHPPRKFEYYGFVAQDKTGRSVKVMSAAQARKFTNLRLHVPVLTKTLARQMWRINCLTVTTSHGDHLAVLLVHCLTSTLTGAPSRRVILLSQPNSTDLGALLVGRPGIIDIADYLQCDLVAYDYSGYGLSTGRPSERHLYADIDAVFEKTTGELGYAPSDVVLFGFSLGTAVSIDLASRQPHLAGVVLIAPFASLLRTFIAMDKETWCIDQFASLDKVGAIVAPTLICHGVKDEVVSVRHGQALYHKLRNPVQPLWIRDANHENIFSRWPGMMWSRVKLFINRQTAVAPL